MTAIRLEPLDESHVAHVETLLEDPEVLRFTRVPEPPPEGFARTWIERYASDGSIEGFAAFTEDGRFAGLALAPEVDREAREVELGYIVTAAERGRGYGTAILRELTAWAFEQAGAERIVLLIDVANAPSLRVAARCGYVQEGVLRSLHVKQGIRSDTTVWSRLPSDP